MSLISRPYGHKTVYKYNILPEKEWVRDILTHIDSTCNRVLI